MTGNKSDMDAQRQVTCEEGTALARKLSVEAGHDVLFIETSAKLNTNVSAAFAGISSPDQDELTDVLSYSGGVCAVVRACACVRCACASKGLSYKDMQKQGLIKEKRGCLLS